MGFYCHPPRRSDSSSGYSIHIQNTQKLECLKMYLKIIPFNEGLYKVEFLDVYVSYIVFSVCEITCVMKYYYT